MCVPGFGGVGCASQASGPQLTAIFNPRKHVPATVEFADIAGVGGARAGAQALLDVAPFRNADALLHVVRMFRDPAVPHPAGSVAELYQSGWRIGDRILRAAMVAVSGGGGGVQ